MNLATWAVVLFLVTQTLGAASLPRWAATNGADVPFEFGNTLTGYGIANAPGKGGDAVQAAKDQALKDLSGKLKVQVDASSRVTDTQEGKANYSSYQSDVKTMVSISLVGVQKFETVFDPEKNAMVALAILDKETMRAALSSDRDGLVSQLDGDLKEVQELAGRNRLDLLQPALKTFDLHLEDLVQNVAVARLLGEGVDAQGVVQKFYDAKSQVRSSLLADKILTESDLVKALVKAFPWQDLSGQKVVLASAVYKTSDSSGQFFAYLRDDLEEAVKALVPSIEVITDTPSARPDFVLLGSYREVGDGYQVRFRLNDVKAQVQAAPTFEATLDGGFVKAQKFEFVPPNLQLATVDRDLQVAVYKQPVRTRLVVWTDKGKSGLTLKEGDRYYFYVNVNRPGYLSLIYNVAGDQPFRVPLLNNYRITESQISADVRLEQQFEVAAPFGVESAHFFFSPDPIPSPATVRTVVDGVPYDVVAEDYATLLVKARGIKKATETSDASAISTDAVLTLTTVAKR